MTNLITYIIEENVILDGIELDAQFCYMHEFEDCKHHS